MLYQFINLIMIIEITIMIKMLYEHLDYRENRTLFVSMAGLAMDIIACYSISNASSVATALVELRVALIGRVIFGIGIIAYMGRMFHARFTEVVFSAWLLAILGALVHSFRMPEDNIYLSDIRLVEINGVNILLGKRGVLYYFLEATVILVGVWGLVFLGLELRKLWTKRKSREWINVFFYISAILIEGIGQLVYEFNFETLPNIMPIVKSLSAGIYLTLVLRYRFFNYDSLATQTLIDDMGAGFIVLSAKKEILYANDITYKLFPELASMPLSDRAIAEINEAIDRREYQLEKNGNTYRITADRIFQGDRIEGYKILLVDISDVVQLEKQAEQNAEARSNLLTNISHEIRTPLNAIIGASEMLDDEGVSGEEYKEYVDVIRAGTMNLDDILNDLLSAATDAGKVRVSDMSPYSVSTLIDNVTTMCNERIANKRIMFSVYIEPDIPIYAIGDDRRIRQMLLNILANAIRYTDDGIVSLRVSGTYLLDGRFEYEYCITDTGKNAFANDVDFENAFSNGNELGVGFSTGYGIGLMVAKKIANAMDGDISIRSIRGRGSIFSVRFPSQLLERKTFLSREYSKKMTVTFLGEYQNGFDSLKHVCHYFDVEADEIPALSQLKTFPEEDERFHVLIYDIERYGKRVEQSEKAQGYLKAAYLQSGKMPKRYEKNCILVSTPLSVLTLEKVLMEYEKGVGRGQRKIKFTCPGARILVVDDNTINLQIAKSMLEQFGAETDVVESGYECLELLENGKQYDLIFMDYMMEGMDGIEATSNIRALPGIISRVPILAFTANVVEGAKEKYLAAGMDDVLFKPANREAFAKALLKFLPKKLILNEDGNPEAEKKNEIPYPEIPGVDIATAQKYSGGNIKIYKDMLATFAIEIDQRKKRAGEFEAARDFINFTIEIHSLKGLARTLGMSELAEHMARMEQAGKEEDIDFIIANTEKLMGELVAYKDILEPFVEEKRAAEIKPTGNDKVELNLIKMHDALEEFEMEEAENAFSEIWPGDYGPERRRLMEKLKDSIEQIDYYASLGYVDELIQTYRENN